MQAWKIKHWDLEVEKAGLRKVSVAPLFIANSRSVDLHGFKFFVPDFKLFKRA